MTTGPASYYQDELVRLYLGDCLDILPELADNSVDAVVTDPPYSISFMSRAWDQHASPAEFQAWCEQWAAECLRILKPGGHLLAFGGTRTSHRLACAIEDAGFEIRDSIAWLYGSGFPKSLNVSAAIDRQRHESSDKLRVTSWLADAAERNGVTRADIDAHMGTSDMGGWWLSRLEHRCAIPTLEQVPEILRALRLKVDDVPAEIRSLLIDLNGMKGQPGPAWFQRPITQAETRPLVSGTTISFDQRASTERERRDIPATPEAVQWQGWGTALKPAHEPIIVARKPLTGTVAANVLRWGTGALNIDASRIGTGSDKGVWPRTDRAKSSVAMSGGPMQNETNLAAGRWPANVALDESQAAALDQMSGDQRDGIATNRNRDNDQLASEAGWGYRKQSEDVGYGQSGGASRFFYTAKASSDERITYNGVSHATVKPLSLMRWLVRLVTPPGGVILEPFAGSGTTVEAALLEGFRCIAIEREADYLPLITQRINRRRDPIAYITAAGDDLGLFGDNDEPEAPSQPLGRWPANVVLDRSQAEALDQMSEGTRAAKPRGSGGSAGEPGEVYNSPRGSEPIEHGGEGNASRFFKVVDLDRKA